MFKHVSIVAIWLIYTMLSFVIVSKERLVEFDKQGVIANYNPQQIGALLTEEFANSFALKSTVLHLGRENCPCSQFTEAHVSSLAKMAEDHQLTNVYKTPSRGSLVYSTPAVAIFDSEQQLIYFGPYGQGIGCSETTGFAQTVLNNHVKGYDDAVIISSAKGCYCTSDT